MSMAKSFMYFMGLCNRVAALFIAFSIVYGSAYCCTKGNISYPPDIKRILDRGYLIVAMSSSERIPFFTASDQGKEDPQGLDIDLAKEIAKNLGVEKVVFLRDTSSFNDVVNNVSNCKADMAISKISFTYNRATKVKYSKRYATLYKTLIINRTSFPEISNITDHEIKSTFNDPKISIGVMQGTSYAAFAKLLFPKAQIIPMEKWEEIIDAVLSKKISAAFWDDLELEKYIDLNAGKYLFLKSLKFTEEKDTLHIIMPWDSHQLANFIELFIVSNDINYRTKDILPTFKKIRSKKGGG
jgi:polar amino acid transport system substrate-binding protein